MHFSPCTDLHGVYWCFLVGVFTRIWLKHLTEITSSEILNRPLDYVAGIWFPDDVLGCSGWAVWRICSLFSHTAQQWRPWWSLSKKALCMPRQINEEAKWRPRILRAKDYPSRQQQAHLDKPNERNPHMDLAPTEFKTAEKKTSTKYSCAYQGAPPRENMSKLHAEKSMQTTWAPPGDHRRREKSNNFKKCKIFVWNFLLRRCLQIWIET